MSDVAVVGRSSPRIAGNSWGGAGRLRGGSRSVGGLVLGGVDLSALVFERQRSAARVMAPNMSLNTGRSPLLAR